MSTFVWIVEKGEYDLYVVGVYSSLEKAVEGIKGSYSSMNSTWKELQKSTEDWFILESRHCHGRAYEQQFNITKWEVDAQEEIKTTS